MLLNPQDNKQSSDIPQVLVSLSLSLFLLPLPHLYEFQLMSAAADDALHSSSVVVHLFRPAAAAADGNDLYCVLFSAATHILVAKELMSYFN